MAIDTGQIVAGRYRLDERLDSGGRAQVWRATDKELGRQVAVKILVAPEGGQPEFLEAFRSEAQIEARLKHPGIVEVFDWGQDGSSNFEIMELLDGQTVDRMLAGGPLGHERVVSIGRQAAGALAYAHAEGIAHGSVGPDRVVVGPQGRATLIDFGLQCRGACEFSAMPDADTYSLGALLYEMLIGMSPTGPRPANVPEREKWPQPPHALNSDIPHELSNVVMKAIAPDPADRYQTAAELQAALDELVRPKSRAWLWILLALLALIAVAAGLYYFSTQMKQIVPDVTGMTQAQASSTLSGAGMKVVVTGQAASPSVPSGSVVSENPPPGSRVSRGAQIGLTISTGRPTANVPSVVGMTLDAASSTITGDGFVLGNITKQNSTTIPDNSVISQSPAAGTGVVAGTTVDLVVSAGQAQVSVPDVRGMPEDDAHGTLVNAGLVVDRSTAFSDSRASGDVISQNPAAGSMVSAGSTVLITVSKGPAPVTVPDVVGAQEADAKTSLQDRGLVPVSVSTSGTPSQVGKVIDQSPNAGAKVKPGSQVTIDVGQ